MSISIFPVQGHPLPPFESLLIKGVYPPSAPLHLCISFLQSATGQSDRVLFLTPSRQSFAAALQDFNDAWLTENAATGVYARLLSNIAIHYPPSTTHWLLLLSLLKPLSASTSRLASIPYTPSLIILHEPSAFFLSSDAPQTLNLSQYLQLVTTALSTASFFSPHKVIPVVLFDSRLGDLKLPVIQPPLSPSRRLFQDHDHDHDSETPARQERVERFVEKYFDWVGVVVDEHDLQGQRTPPKHSTFDISEERRMGPFKLSLEKRSSDEHVVLEWSETKSTRRSNATIPETEFLFYDIV